MQYTKPLGGVIVMSGFYMGNQAFRPCIANEDLPIFICHGETDKTLPWKVARETFECIPRRNRVFIVKILEGESSSVNYDGYLFIR